MDRAFPRPSAILASCLALLQVVLVTTPAFAADGDVERTVAVIELRQGPDANSLTTDYIREVAKTFGELDKGDYILVPTEKVVQRLGTDRQQVAGALTPERRASLDEARKKGIEYLDKADAANAIKALQAAESKYRASIAAPGADEALRRSYLDVLVQLATAHIIAKDNDAAREVFRNVVTSFGPSAPITDDEYRPDVVAIFQSVVTEMKKMPQGSVDVASSPLGARVLLGGIDRGETPVQVGNLIPGVYSLRLTQGSSTSMLHRVRVDASKSTKISIDLQFESHLVLDDGAAGLTYKDLDEARSRIGVDALAIGRAMEVNIITVVGVVDRKLHAFIVDVASGKVTQSPATSVPQIGVSKRAVTRIVNGIIGKADTGPVGEEGDKKAWYTSVPGWAVGGAGVVALGVGLAFAGSLSGAELFPCETDPYQSQATCPAGRYGTPIGVSVAKKEQEAVQGDQTLSGVGLGLGAALLAGSAVLFYLHAKSGPDVAMLRDGNGNSLLPPVGFGSERTVFVATP